MNELSVCGDGAFVDVGNIVEGRFGLRENRYFCFWSGVCPGTEADVDVGLEGGGESIA
jgi:hypothetical protein